MSQTIEIDVEQLMEQIRERISKSKLEMSPPEAPIPLTDTQIPADLAFLQSSYDIYHFNLVSHRKVLGRVVLFAKNVLRQLLTPILERQLAFNAATARVAQYLWEQPQGIRQQQVTILQTVQQTLEALDQRQTAALQELRTEMLERVQAWIRQTEDKLGALQMMATQLQDRITIQEQVQQESVMRFEQVQQDNLRVLEQVQQESVMRFEQVQEDNLRVREQVQESVMRFEQVQQETVARFEQVQQDNLRVREQVQESVMRFEQVQQETVARFEQVQQDNLRVREQVQESVMRFEQVQQETVARFEQVQQDDLRMREQVQQESVTRIGSVLNEQTRRFMEWEKVFSYLKTDVILQERRITVLLDEARRRLPEAWSQEQLRVIADVGKHELEALYVAFEDQFRGTREDIKSRFQVYIPLLKEGKLGADQLPILDVGCGRGEWLELLKDEGLRAQGVDLNRVLVEECHRRGLETIESEAVSYLSSLPQNSVGAVTGFHIIEHLPLEKLVRLLDETVRILKPGGVAIFETPNPENVLVGSHNFYLDPTHRNPLPSATIKFLVEARGLCRVEIINLHPYPESQQLEDTGLDIVKRFNRYFYGPQDYAVVGWKVS